MTEQGAAPDNGVAVEPREAQRPTSLAARTPTAAIPGNGDIAVGVRLAANGRPGGPLARASDRHMGASQAPWRHRKSGLPDLRTKYADLGYSRDRARSIPSWGKRKKGKDAPASQIIGAAERWLNGTEIYFDAHARNSCASGKRLPGLPFRYSHD
jgi:hypothetical protein